MARTAAIVILAVLAHALLMTADAGAMTHVAAPTATGFAVRNLPPPDATHEVSCFTVVTVVKSAPPTVPVDGAVAPISNDATAQIPLSPIYRTPPHYPPDTVRALLQVYRI